MEVEWVFGTFDAKLTCVDGVINPGTEETEMKISCIHGGKWNRDIPVCSRKKITIISVQCILMRIQTN